MQSNHSTQMAGLYSRRSTHIIKESLLLPPVPMNNIGSLGIVDIPKINTRKFDLTTAPRAQPVSPKNDQVTSSNLTEKLIGDVVVAAGVTFAFSPFLTVVDKAIIQRAAGTHTIARSSMESVVTMARNPITFIKSPSFLMMWGVYAATYTTANCLKTAVEHYEYTNQRDREESSQKIQYDRNNTEHSVSKFGKTATFIGTTVVNSSASILKDRSYARMFGTSGATSKVPAITMGLWASRDVMVIGSSFVLPELVSEALKGRTSLTDQKALSLSQFLCPVLTQVIAGPVQLLGLDFYNRPMPNVGYAEAAMDRARFIGQNFSSVVAARIARMAPAYGIGGIGNTYFRNAWRSMLIRREMEKLEGADKEQDRKERARNLVGLVMAKERDQKI